MNLHFVIKLTFLLRLPAKEDTSCWAVWWPLGMAMLWEAAMVAMMLTTI